MKVHVVQHVPFEGLGSIERWLADRRAEVSHTRFYASPVLPEIAGIDLVIVLGGPMGVDDEGSCPWLAAEKRFVGDCIDRGLAVLGICLGAQIIAAVLGARVYANPVREIGWWPLHLLPAAADSPLFRDFPAEVEVFHWHGDTFELPPGADHIARSAACAHQAFVYRERVVGLQFHLETTGDSARQLISRCGGEIVPGPCIQSAAAMTADPWRFARINGLMYGLLDNIASGIGARTESDLPVR
ncbi:type 1 glutamine amidotransferase [Desulfoprunum benzoelyticum]|uniref:GMP synthase-like glutamine amidotransferase n=1 Tax=Desulfoprunum benzoelyticum TaxID=1506996 RepID=A0A840UW95_9BACT|nr:type 1 glutamine amidotransferase [Desulfoprunum benzoelyticum]MBB5349106.1 GMP synthase-like glutamine amidotransferase [Desulfoprunum benzoelyticum]MBM9530655.1 type 1 glutamine amidotransferase [Desulfoprunum benzoelyticum]